MVQRITSSDTLEAAVLGGALLGGGGGGGIEEGLHLGRLALERGGPLLADPDELPPDGILLTVSAVGAPSAPDRSVSPEQYVAAVESFLDVFKIDVAGLITNENGGMATVNGWLQSAVLGIPVADVPCNGRAHPTGVMGSMGLDAEPQYVSRQVAVGGNEVQGRQVVVSVEAALRVSAQLIRDAAVAAGGLVAVARNPVSVRYALEHGAPGAIAKAVELGRLLQPNAPPSQRAKACAERLGGQIIHRGTVSDKRLESRGGFDVGWLRIGDYELTLWNEYMTLEQGGQRLGTFPDLIATLSAASARPLSTAEIRPGDEVFLLWAPRDHLILGAGMRRPELFQVVEKAVGKEIIAHVFPDEGRSDLQET
ncbi:MAG: DUF917 family protein [Anaerolineae bacterium]